MSRRDVRTPALIAGSCVAAMIAAGTALGFGGNNGTICPSPVGPDVIVGDIQSVTNYAASGGIDAFSIGTTSCNVGNANLLWQQFTGSNRHPAISQNMFKYKVVNGSGRFEHIGQSWLKHGFFALTENICGCGCNGQGNQVLGVGCSDPYTAARNGTQSGLGPKWQVNASSGWFPAVATPPYAGTVARRLQVKTSELEVAAGVFYFVEGQYNSQDDAAFGNKNNNASHRQVTLSGGPTDFTIAAASTTQRTQPGIRAWQNLDPSVTLTNIVTPETPIGVQNPYPAYDPNCCTTGLVIVGAKATHLGGGIWHYEYAVQNQNSDRSIGSFSVPLSGPVTITNIGFHDVDYHSNDGEGSVTRDGTNWPSTVNANEIRWETTPYASNPNANALRWGTLYNFRFDANTPPTTGDVSLGMWKIPSTVTGATVIPTPVVPPPQCLTDFNQDGATGTPDLLELINAWGPCPGCPEDLDGSGAVGTPDLLMLINAWGPCKPG